MGKLDEAIEQYERALTLNPKFSEAHSNLGMAFQALGKLDEAVVQFERAVALKPNLAELTATLVLRFGSKAKFPRR